MGNFSKRTESMNLKAKRNNILVLFNDEEPRSDIEERVMLRINRLRMTKQRVAAYIYSFAALLSVLFAVPIINHISNDISRSGSLYFITLFFSDSAHAIENWKALVLSFFSSWPIFETFIFLFLILIFVFSIQHVAKKLPSISFRKTIST